MVGIAVPTIDWSSEDRNMLAMSAPKMSQTVRWVRTMSGLSLVVGAAVDMRGTSFGSCGWGGGKTSAVVDEVAQVGDGVGQVLVRDAAAAGGLPAAQGRAGQHHEHHAGDLDARVVLGGAAAARDQGRDGALVVGHPRDELGEQPGLGARELVRDREPVGA